MNEEFCKAFLNELYSFFSFVLLSPYGDFMINISDIKRKWFDVSYANKSKAEKMDIYLPNSDIKQFPVLMLIHGGGFWFGDKQGIGLKIALKPALDNGFAVVSINYRLSTEALFPAAPEDVNAAIRFVRTNAVKYHLDPNYIAVWGSSSGGKFSLTCRYDRK